MLRRLLTTLLLLTLSLAAQAQVPGIYIGATPVIGGSDGSCLGITGATVVTMACSGGGGSGVSTFSGGSTGLLPSSPATGAVALDGVLIVGNGGTGTTTSTGIGSTVLSNSPVLVTPTLGQPTAVDLLHATNLPILTGVSGLGTAVPTALTYDASAATMVNTFTLYNMAFWGDSYTYGINEPGNVPWPSQLAQYIGYRHIYNGGISGQSTDLILARLQAAPQYWAWTSTFEGGLNDLTDMGPTPEWAAHVKANFASMVQTIGHNNYRIIGLVNSGREYIGTPAGLLFEQRYVAILALNNDLATIYGDHFVDIRTWTVNNALGALGITPTSGDLIDIGHDVPPRSLRIEPTDIQVHPNSVGYHAVALRLSSEFNTMAATPNPVVTSTSLLKGLGTGVVASGLPFDSLTGYSLGDTSQGGGLFLVPPTGQKSNTYIGFGVVAPTAPPGTSLEITGVGQGVFNSGSIGRGNTAVGAFVMPAVTGVNGSFNTGVGGTALQSVIDGSGNTAVGYLSLNSMLSGSGNTAVGQYSLANSMSLNPSTAVGYQAMVEFTASSGTAVGYQAMKGSTGIALAGTTNGTNVVTTTSDPIAAGVTVNSVIYGTFIPAGVTITALTTGTMTLSASTTGTSASATFQVGSVPIIVFSGNTTSGSPIVGASPGPIVSGAFIGMPITGTFVPVGTTIADLGVNTITLSANATGTTASNAAQFRVGGVAGNNNSAFGRVTLAGISSGANNNGVGSSALTATTIGNDNNAIGVNAMAGNVSGARNTAIGTNALSAEKNPSDHVAIGHQAMLVQSAGTQNVAVGSQSMVASTTGGSNVGVGYQTLHSSTTSVQNVAVGSLALSGVTTGTGGNIGVGYQAGANLTSGFQNIVIGFAISAPTPTSNQTLNIGNYVFGTGFSATGTSISPGRVGLGVVGPETALHVAGAITLTAGSAPGTPAVAGEWALYSDATDGNKLKAKASTGTVVTLGTP